jgi:hypothetical protein
VIAELSRWGYRWAWGHPRPNESVDVGAAFRATAGLLDDAPLGLVELRVGEQRYWLSLGLGAAQLLEQAPGPEPDAVIAGDEADWLTALGPGATAGALTRTGDAALATLVLATIAPRADDADEAPAQAQLA